MAKSHVTLISEIQNELQDDGTKFDDAFLTIQIAKGLAELSEFSPLIVRESLSTTADSKDLDISSIYNLMHIEALEYRTGKTPREFRNWKEYYNNTISMLIDFQPSADETVYLYCAKHHKLSPMADLAGAVDLPAGYAAGLATIHVDGLPLSGTLEADITFTIASDSSGTRYRLTQDTTIANNEGDITFTPVLAETVANDDVVTFDNSTFLTPQLENLLVDLVAATANISKANYYINKVNIGARAPWADRLSWGQNKLALTLRELRRIRKRTSYQVYPRV